MEERMNNRHDLTTQLWDLLTKEEVEKGYVHVSYDVGINTDIPCGSSMVERIKEESPYGDHIIGFKRWKYKIELILDEEGQKKWDAKEEDIRKFYGI